jgi:hypothetical protein
LSDEQKVHRPMTLIVVDASWQQPGNGADEILQLLDENLGDGLLVEFGEHGRGLFALLQAAARRRRPMLPARWLPARPLATGGLGDPAKILWVARSDAALARLLAEAGMGLEVPDSASTDHPFALLGVEGDVLGSPASDDAASRLERAQRWVHRLGIDRVALAVPLEASDDDPLVQLARECRLPAIRLARPEDLTALLSPRMAATMAPAMSNATPVATPHAPPQSMSPAFPPPSTQPAPLLWTDFQLDREHRLPDEAYVPGLRDLLHRGSLLRERTLFERLPAAWRTAAESELRALYAWHVSPLLRRAAALLQTLAPLPSVRVSAPLQELEGVCAYLLGLTDRRPAEDAAPQAAGSAATALATALQQWDRRLTVAVQAAVWPRLSARLVPWIDAGMLAACSEAPAHPGRRFCFSGEPLWARAPLARDLDGVPCVSLDEADRRALGWFELELHAEGSVAPPRGRTRAGRAGDASAGDAIVRMPAAAGRRGGRGRALVTGEPERQLDLGLEGWGT